MTWGNGDGKRLERWVVSWGDDYCGGDSSCVQDQLQGIKEIFGASKAFVAISNGSTVTWGHHLFGGDSSSVQACLQNTKVQRLVATCGAVAALLEDGQVVTWGNARQGGDSSAVQDQLRNVTDLAASAAAFAAIADGCLVTWGHPDFGGESDLALHPDRLGSTQLGSLCASAAAFGAVRADGSLITWGHPRFGGRTDVLCHRNSVTQLLAPMHNCAVGFAALLSDGSVTTWGNNHEAMSCMKGVRMLLGVSGGAYVALTTDGHVRVWGDETAGGDSSQVHDCEFPVEAVEDDVKSTMSGDDVIEAVAPAEVKDEPADAMVEEASQALREMMYQREEPEDVVQQRLHEANYKDRLQKVQRGVKSYLKLQNFNRAMWAETFGYGKQERQFPDFWEQQEQRIKEAIENWPLNPARLEEMQKSNEVQDWVFVMLKILGIDEDEGDRGGKTTPSGGRRRRWGGHLQVNATFTKGGVELFYIDMSKGPFCVFPEKAVVMEIWRQQRLVGVSLVDIFKPWSPAW
eukprot:symbB.v1.2.032142.t1/scaffold3818.1/size49771/1